MDKQSAAESQLSTERARVVYFVVLIQFIFIYVFIDINLKIFFQITNMVLFLLKMVVLVDSTHECDDLIASIFSQAELCDWDESIMEQLEITYKQLSETNSIGPVLQKRLASQALRTRGPHYLDVLRIIIEGGSNVIRSVLASLLFNDIVERLEISVKNGSNQALVLHIFIVLFIYDFTIFIF
uniref:H15 domain-containing protein n=1 Tax=Heterorhabditis bacteriophora TaxID=37862 RepID=A0A1I7WCE8_HETBA